MTNIFKCSIYHIIYLIWLYLTIFLGYILSIHLSFRIYANSIIMSFHIIKKDFCIFYRRVQ